MPDRKEPRECKITPESAKRMISNIDRWLGESGGDQPNDAAMKAAYTPIEMNAIQEIEMLGVIRLGRCTADKEHMRKCAEIIDRRTHLSAKEEALRELVEELEDCRDTLALIKKMAIKHGDIVNGNLVLDSIDAALAKAKEALNP